MSVMFLTDLHLDLYRPYSTILKSGMNSRLYDQMMVVNKVSELIKEKQPSIVVYMGDLFNGITESLPKIIYNAGFLAVQAWSQYCPIYLIVGNHDIYRGMHAFSAFAALQNVHIIAKTTQVRVDKLIIDCVPWGCALPEVKGTVCAGHLEVFGTTLDGTYTCKTGIQPSRFEGYRYVLLGHFHNPQEFLVKGAKEARYIGSVMQTDRRRSPAGFMGVVILSDDTLIGHPIDSPRILTHVVNNQGEMDECVKRIQEGDYHRVVVTDENVVVPRTSYRVAVEYNLPEISTSRLSIQDTTQSWSDKLQEATKAYIEKANTKLDKETLVKLAQEFLG